MRLFIAIPLSDEMKSAVTGTMHEMKKAGVKGSYVPTRNLHLTLAFIGEMKEAASVSEALSFASVVSLASSVSSLLSDASVAAVSAGVDPSSRTMV